MNIPVELEKLAHVLSTKADESTAKAVHAKANKEPEIERIEENRAVNAAHFASVCMEAAKELRRRGPKMPANLPPSAVTDFDIFWAEYPKNRRIGKAEAQRAWATHAKDRELKPLLEGLQRCKKSKDWTKDEGKFIPHPSTWIRRQGWLDYLDSAEARDAQRVQMCRWSDFLRAMSRKPKDIKYATEVEMREFSQWLAK